MILGTRIAWAVLRRRERFAAAAVAAAKNWASGQESVRTMTFKARSVCEDRGAPYLHLGRRTDQPPISTNPLADGAGHTLNSALQLGALVSRSRRRACAAIA